jgi:hypothetical protein
MRIYKQSNLLFLGLFLFAAVSCKKAELAPASEERLVSTAAANALSGTAAQNAATTFHSTVQINDESENWSPCTGEWIHFTGEALLNVHFTFNNNKIHGEYHYNPQGEKGVGLSSGLQYQGVGVINRTFSISQINGVYTYNQRIRIALVAPGSGNNLVWSADLHVTINANGELTAFRDNETLECQ